MSAEGRRDPPPTERGAKHKRRRARRSRARKTNRRRDPAGPSVDRGGPCRRRRRSRRAPGTLERARRSCLPAIRSTSPRAARRENWLPRKKSATPSSDRVRALAPSSRAPSRSDDDTGRAVQCDDLRCAERLLACERSSAARRPSARAWDGSRSSSSAIAARSSARASTSMGGLARTPMRRAARSVSRRSVRRSRGARAPRPRTRGVDIIVSRRRAATPIPRSGVAADVERRRPRRRSEHGARGGLKPRRPGRFIARTRGAPDVHGAGVRRCRP